MILLSPAAAEDVERLRTFLDETNPDAAQRALALIWTTIERLQDLPALGSPTEDVESARSWSASARLAILCAMPSFLRQKTFSWCGSGMDAKRGFDGYNRDALALLDGLYS